jgi:hypothetical protein
MATSSEGGVSISRVSAAGELTNYTVTTEANSVAGMIILTLKLGSVIIAGPDTVRMSDFPSGSFWPQMVKKLELTVSCPIVNNLWDVFPHIPEQRPECPLHCCDCEAGFHGRMMNMEPEEPQLSDQERYEQQFQWAVEASQKPVSVGLIPSICKWVSDSRLSR